MNPISEKKPLPLACEDFKTVIADEYYYVDKTGLIKELLDKKSKLVLFTRPRRFGKTLNQSMLKYFFEKTEEDNSVLFNGLEISKYGDKYMKFQGQYPVISVTFKDMKHDAFSDAFEAFKILMTEEFIRHNDILDSGKLSHIEVEQYKTIINGKGSVVQYKFALGFLSDCLYKVYGKKTVVLIDEYDVPLENAHFFGFYTEMVDLIRSCFSKALKTTDSVQLGVLTGCLRVSKESIFTGFNNPTVYSVTNVAFSQYFGFTNIEVSNLLAYYDVSDSIEEVKEWYDGYIFGETEIYNPFSLISYVGHKIENDTKPAIAYWSNTSSNSIIKDLVSKCNDKTKEDLEKLMHGETILKPIYIDLTYGDLGKTDDSDKPINERTVNSDQIWSHLLFTGYLKQKYNENQNMYELQIPNHEVMETYTKIIKDAFQKRVDSSSRDDLFRAILAGDAETVNLIMNDWLYDSISYHDEKESFYHGTIHGMLSGFKGYRLESNREAGLGRFDLMLYDDRRRSVGICFEFKIAEKPELVDAMVEDALQQIQEKDYTQFFRVREITNIIRYGAAFCDKRCKLKVQMPNE